MSVCCRDCATPVEIATTFIVCRICGDKRCPQAENHRNKCQGLQQGPRRATEVEILRAKLQTAEETGAEATRMMVAAIARKEELEAAIRYHRESLTSGRTVCDQVLWMYVSREPE